MKVASIALGSLALAASASAQYFSEGWRPGQPTYVTQEPAPGQTPGAQLPIAGGGSSFDFSKVFTGGPVGSLLAKAGLNFSAVANGTEELWDPRIPFINDENYEDMIVNEPLTPEEEERRTWFVIISTAMGQQTQGGVSKIVDKHFDLAYNMSVVENDLPDLRFARIDYLNVTYLTTKWNIWSGPWLMIIRDRGQSLRFFNVRHIRVNSTILREFLKEEIWRNSEPWSSSFAPGGKREFMLHYFALGMKKVYDTVVRVPRIFLMIGTGALGSVLMRLLHRGNQQPQPQSDPTPESKTLPNAPSTPATPATPSKKSGGKGKKTARK